jgi:tRNA nucleotidyltransferase (CCA-adding enzyme)
VITDEGKITSHGHADAGVEPSQNFLTNFFIPQELKTHIISLVKEHMFIHEVKEPTDAAVRRLARRLAPATIEELANLATADIQGSFQYKTPTAEYANAQALLQKALELDVKDAKPKPLLLGRDLLEIGFKPGKHIGSILKEIEELQLDGHITSEEEARAYAQKLFNTQTT